MRADRRALAQMLQDERRTTADAAALTAVRSAGLALHAFRTTAFYREHYTSAGFSEADVAQPENFAALPALTKSMLQDAGDALISSTSTAKDRLPSRTGGSTGRPLLVYNDRTVPTAALWWRVYSWWGVHPADDAAFIYRQSRTGVKKLRYDAEWWPTRHILLDARGSTADTLAAFDRQMARVRPRLLVGYVEGVAGYAAHVSDQRGERRGLAAISVTASMLHPGQRARIESALGAPVFDTYRSAEVPWIAAECDAHDGLHVLSDRRRVDIVDDDGVPAAAGEVGSVLVSDFDNRVFPLVRYAIGDRTAALPGTCACGRSLTRIAPIQGRIADVLRTPSGRTVAGGLSALFIDWPGTIRQFQVHQAADYSVTIRYVVEADAARAADAADQALRALVGFLGDEVAVSAHPVEQIENVAGKARLVVSDVSAAGSSG